MSVILVFSLLTFKSSSAATELDEREVVFSAARKAFLAERFTELNEMSRRYRVEKTRTHSGVWKLSWFYQGISNAIRSQRGDPETAFREAENTAGRWIRKYPKAPAPRIAYAMVRVARAWAYRGTGNGSTVSKENSVEFHKYLYWARSGLEEDKRLAAVDPQWYVTMLTIARGQNWSRSDFDSLMAEAVKREPLFYQTYFEAAEYLLPRWHGSIRQLEAFAQDAADRTSKSEGQGLYARIYWNAAQTQFGDKLFTASSADWSRMKRGFDDVIARYPDAWNLNNYAKFACLAEDKTTTRELLDRIGSNVDSDAWYQGPSRARCVEWANEAE